MFNYQAQSDNRPSIKSTEYIMHETETITGYIDRLLFYNEENGFVVFILQLSSKQTTTVKGFMPPIHPGEQVSVQGSWIMHPKFGKQFEAQQCTKQVPTSILGLKKTLFCNFFEFRALLKNLVFFINNKYV